MSRYIVVDATRLERNLNLVLQVLEITGRAVVCLNLIDEARRHKLTVDERAFSSGFRCAGCAHSGLASEKAWMSCCRPSMMWANGRIVGKPHRIHNESRAVKEAVGQLSSRLEATFPNLS